MTDAFFATAFVLWGSGVTWLELVAVSLAVVMVACNMREIHWGWPLAIVSSLLYVALFWRSGVYGQAALQLLFATLAAWGWFQWLRGTRGDGARLRAAWMPQRARAVVLVAGALLWPVVAWFLVTFTDSKVPWWDAFPTAWSLVGQFLLARKFIENWIVWILVDVVATGLFAFQGLWFTAALYALFIPMCVFGMRRWMRTLPARPAP
jgi:nicotinamide mononucleotide transporter